MLDAPQWLYAGFRRIEYLAGYAQGKGFGQGTVRREVDAVARFLRPAPQLAIDMGAHKGSYTRALKSRYPELEIHIFEPSPLNVAALRASYAGDPRVTICPVAVSSSAGEAVLYADRPGSGYASLYRRRLDHWDVSFDVEETVRTIRFEDYWREALRCGTVDIVKMDVEGHELEALTGFGKALEAVKVIQFELGGTSIASRCFFQDFFYFFSSAGFKLYRITPLGLQRVQNYREREEHFFIVNYVAVRGDEN